MDLTKYEKIDGREALKRLLGGEEVRDVSDDAFILDGTIFVLVRKSGAYEILNDSLRRILENDWYIPKPFDVRQAMRDKPGKWLGAYQNDEGQLFKVGFDAKHFNVIAKLFNSELPVNTETPGVSFPSPEEIDRCIPIEDVLENEK
jgi:hypothetical protein